MFCQLEVNVIFTVFNLQQFVITLGYVLGASKKTGKPIKPRKPEKKTEKTEPKFFFFLKKPAGSVRFRFRFYNQKTEKTEPNRTEPKPTKNLKKTEPDPKNRAKTDPNWFEPVFALKKPNRTEIGRFDPVSVRFRFFFKKNFQFDYFFYKNQTEPKIITSNVFVFQDHNHDDDDDCSYCPIQDTNIRWIKKMRGHGGYVRRKDEARTA